MFEFITDKILVTKEFYMLWLALEVEFPTRFKAYGNHMFFICGRTGETEKLKYAVLKNGELVSQRLMDKEAKAKEKEAVREAKKEAKKAKKEAKVLEAQRKKELRLMEKEAKKAKKLELKERKVKERKAKEELAERKALELYGIDPSIMDDPANKMDMTEFDKQVKTIQKLVDMEVYKLKEMRNLCKAVNLYDYLELFTKDFNLGKFDDSVNRIMEKHTGFTKEHCKAIIFAEIVETQFKGCLSRKELMECYFFMLQFGKDMTDEMFIIGAAHIASTKVIDELGINE